VADDTRPPDDLHAALAGLAEAAAAIDAASALGTPPRVAKLIAEANRMAARLRAAAEALAAAPNRTAKAKPKPAKRRPWKQ
jgi:hypothetical protein